MSSSFNCGKEGHLKRDYRQGIPRNNVRLFVSGENPNRRAEGVAKASTGQMSADPQGTGKVTPCHQEIPQGPPAGPQIKSDPIIPCQH